MYVWTYLINSMQILTEHCGIIIIHRHCIDILASISMMKRYFWQFLIFPVWVKSRQYSEFRVLNPEILKARADACCRCLAYSRCLVYRAWWVDKDPDLEERWIQTPHASCTDRLTAINIYPASGRDDTDTCSSATDTQTQLVTSDLATRRLRINCLTCAVPTQGDHWRVTQHGGSDNNCRHCRVHCARGRPPAGDAPPGVTRDTPLAERPPCAGKDPASRPGHQGARVKSVLPRGATVGVCLSCSTSRLNIRLIRLDPKKPGLSPGLLSITRSVKQID